MYPAGETQEGALVVMLNGSTAMRSHEKKNNKKTLHYFTLRIVNTVVSYSRPPAAQVL